MNKQITKRTNTKKVMVGNVQIGQQNKIVIQSMTTTQPKNINATIKQIHALEEKGCEIVRVAIYDKKDAFALKAIKSKINIPLVADIHFNYTLAFDALENDIDKIRINPGTIGSKANLEKIVNMCKAKHIPIRIGINSGSLEKKVIDKYGWTSQAIVESAKLNVKLLEDLNFYDIIISLKASEVPLAVESYMEAAKLFPYPLHLGITEAGGKERGSVKSAAGLGILIHQKIGDTIRISLNCNPEEEILVAKYLLSAFDLADNFPKLIACPTCGRLQYDMFPVVSEIENFLLKIKSNIRVAIMGCPVNGIGEAKESDVALAGGKDSGMLYINGEYKRIVKRDVMVEELKKEILLWIKNEKKITK